MQFTWNDGKKITKWIYWENYINYDDFERAASDCDYLQIWNPRHVDVRIERRYKEILSIIEGREFDFGDKVYSKSINLEMTNEQILADFKKTRRYETRRAMERDKLEISFSFPNKWDKDIDEYVSFYNTFAEKKNLISIYGEKVEKMLALLNSYMFALGKARDQSGKILVIHAYLMCEEMRIVALYSSSSVEYDSLVSRANGYLHYRAM